MMNSLDHLLLGLLLLVTGCSGPTDEAVPTTPTAVQDSLRGVRALEGKAAQAARAPEPKAPALCDLYAARADTLRGIEDELADRIDEMKLDLVESDLDGSKVGEQMFAKGDAGNALFRSIQAFYARAERYSADPASGAEVHRFAATAFPFATADAWRMKEFFGIPRAAVVTLLSRTRADLAHAESLCIRSMLSKCVGKSSVPASGYREQEKKDTPKTKKEHNAAPPPELD